MSCTCFSVRLFTGFALLVINTSASHATGANVSPASWLRLKYAGRALAARSTLPDSVWSMPSTVLNGVTSRCPSPVSANAFATASTRPSVLTWSPRTISAGPEALCRDSRWRVECLAGAAVAARVKARENDAASRLNERADMNAIPDEGVEEMTGRLWRNPPHLRRCHSVSRAAFHRRCPQSSKASGTDSSSRPSRMTSHRRNRERVHNWRNPSKRRNSASLGTATSRLRRHARRERLSGRIQIARRWRGAPQPRDANGTHENPDSPADLDLHQLPVAHQGQQQHPRMLREHPSQLRK